MDVTSDKGNIIGGAIGLPGRWRDPLKALATTTNNGGISGSTVTASAGAISMTAGGVISWTGALAAGTTIGVQSTNSTVSLATTSSPGTQTIEGNGNVSFTTLTTTGTGDVDVTSDKGNIIGGAIGAADGATLKALATTTNNGGISGSAVTASAGAISMTAGGVITWTGALQAGTTIGVQSTNNTVSLATTSSPGTQTIEGSGNVSFTTLATTGTGTGDVDVTSDTGSISDGGIGAAGGVTLKALATTTNNGGISGSTVTASAGAISMTGGGAISWTGALQAGTTIGVQSTNSTVSLATTSSLGTQTIEGDGNVTFTTLTTTGTGDVDVTSDKGNIIGGAIGAAGGATLKALATTAGNGGISGSTVTASAGAISMTGGGAISWTGALAAGTTIGVQSTNSTVSLATTSSLGTQTIEGNGNVTFTTLTTTGTGDVDVTSDAGSIIGGGIGAADGATLKALATTAGNGGVSGSTVTATAGAISMTGGGAVRLDRRAPGRHHDRGRSTNRAVSLATTLSLGTQTIEGNGNICMRP